MTARPDEALTWTKWLNEFGFKDLVSLPGPVGAQLWEPTDADRDAAWELYTELRTRITTQTLHYQAGDEKTALDSVVELFKMTRALIRTHKRECSHFATLSVFVLNQVVRPFTARWHRRLVDDRLSTGDDRHQFRAELQPLQDRLRQFMSLLGRLSENDRFVQGSESGSADPTPQKAETETPIPFDIIFDSTTPNVNELKQREREVLISRRTAIDPNKKQTPTDVIGLAISGGGIRSATFALGVVQQLAERGLLREFDYLSTVSGGGYLGSFLSSYLNDSDSSVGPNENQLPFQPSGHSESPPLRHLRNRSKSLVESGPIAKIRVAAQALYGVALSLLAVAPVVVLLALAVYYGDLLGVNSWQSRLAGVLWPFVAWISALLLLPLIQRAGKGLKAGQPYKQFQTLYEWACFLGFLIILAGFVVGLLLIAYQGYLSAFSSLSPLAIIGAAVSLPLLLTAVSLIVGWERWIGRLLLVVAGLCWPLLLVVVSFALTAFVNRSQAPQLILGLPAGEAILWLAFLGTLLYAVFFVDVNLLSPHSYYRNQLAKTYLIRKSGGGVERIDPQLLSKLQDPAKAPYHLINAAVNLSSSRNPDLRGRSSDFFLLSKCFCGSPTTGYYPTTNFEAVDKHLDLGTAMAISGAALSPQMGVGTIRQLSFALGLANLRLGYWLRNPGRVYAAWLPTWLRSPGAWYLLREMFGSLHEGMSYLNLSDGGHIENLGVYELLRRRCKFIVCVDGEADPTMCFTSLIQVIRYAAIDLGVEVVLDLDDIRVQPSRLSLAHFAVGRIRYPGGHKGLLLYIKSSLTGNEREYVLDYRFRNQAFPHESTAKQLYGEAQFEAYRALGYHVGNELFRREMIGVITESLTVRTWFAALAKNLLAE